MSILFSDNSSSRHDSLNSTHGINPSPMSTSSQSISSSEHLPWPPESNRRNSSGLRQWILWLPRYFLRLLNADGPDSEFDGNVPVENEVALFFQTFLSVGALSVILSMLDNYLWYILFCKYNIIDVVYPNFDMYDMFLLVLISVFISHFTVPFDSIWPFASHFNDAPIAIHHETGILIKKYCDITNISNTIP